MNDITVREYTCQLLEKTRKAVDRKISHMMAGMILAYMPVYAMPTLVGLVKEYGERKKDPEFKEDKLHMNLSDKVFAGIGSFMGLGMDALPVFLATDPAFKEVSIGNNQLNYLWLYAITNAASLGVQLYKSRKRKNKQTISSPKL